VNAVRAKFKIVTEVRKTGASVAALTNYAETTIRPHLEAILDTNTALDFTSREREGRMKVWQLAPNRYGFYPKIIFRGVTDMARDLVLARFNLIRDEMATQITTDLIADGGTVEAQVAKVLVAGQAMAVVG